MLSIHGCDGLLSGFNMLADRKGSCTRSIHASPKASNLLDWDQDLYNVARFVRVIIYVIIV